MEQVPQPKRTKPSDVLIRSADTPKPVVTNEGLKQTEVSPEHADLVAARRKAREASEKKDADAYNRLLASLHARRTATEAVYSEPDASADPYESMLARLKARTAQETAARAKAAEPAELGSDQEQTATEQRAAGEAPPDLTPPQTIVGGAGSVLHRKPKKAS